MMPSCCQLKVHCQHPYQRADDLRILSEYSLQNLCDSAGNILNLTYPKWRPFHYYIDYIRFLVFVSCLCMIDKDVGDFSLVIVISSMTQVLNIEMDGLWSTDFILYIHDRSMYAEDSMSVWKPKRTSLTLPVWIPDSTGQTRLTERPLTPLTASTTLSWPWFYLRLWVLSF